MTVDVDFNAINSRKNRLQGHKDFLEAQRAEENRVSAERDKNVLGADYSGYNSIDAMIRGVNTEQLAVLKNRNESFKKRLAEMNETMRRFPKIIERGSSGVLRGSERSHENYSRDGWIRGVANSDASAVSR